MVEVDASCSGLGAVLSQRHGDPGKLHPCAFYSRKLTVAEGNYDVGNRDLLAIKAALEEWRHWLEGAHHPFQVLTDHRNLEYLRGAKRLNPRQAWWAIFFTRFVFTVTYRPGSKNGKADALSRQFETANEPDEPDLILPATAILAPVQWDLMEEIRRAHADEPPPASCPLDRIFVPQLFRQQVMQWVHEAPSSGHPGIHRSTQLTRRQFWWPSLGSDVEEYVHACSTCAQAGTSRHLPERLLEPLLIPRRPWSHLSVDFLTDLPDSGGYRHGRSGSVLQGVQVDSSQVTTHGHAVGRSHVPAPVPQLRPAQGHRVGSGSAVYLPGVGVTVCPSGHWGEPEFGLPPSIKRAGGAAKPGDWPLPQILL
ncbi:hypothetical protein QTP70_002186 [Hemibagrus guttatus]|uniref:Gypsy retrotransposon integrase-like protein 1 n=1 Tax=Hemibagrus guttatus TaxID=175788 RepID=A0AAE0PQ85_9TELE|nr:hypothetical protein QTP70_002186 [Hemibagrus guttatus]KAK3566929.1 hypothetical protein QTP86_005594 [Hemibagrus guttatus]